MLTKQGYLKDAGMLKKYDPTLDNLIPKQIFMNQKEIKQALRVDEYHI